MIKAYLRPLFKRYAGIFASMVAVSMLAISLMVSFLTALNNLSEELVEYRNAYGSADGLVDTSLVSRSSFDGISDLPEVADAEERLVTYCNVQKADARVITCRLLTYKSNDDVYKLYYDQQDFLPESPDVCIEHAYAANNGYKVGDTINIGFFNFYVPCRVGAIVKTPESMYVRAEDYIWSDNIDFGYVYVDEARLGDILEQVGDMIEEKLAEDPDYETVFESLINSAKGYFPSLREIGNGLAPKIANQVLLKAAPGVDEQTMMNAVIKYLEDNTTIEVKSHKLGSETPAVQYMNRCVSQLNVAGIFLPAFFFGVALLITALFINQILKSMTPEIGTMVSIGISPKAITGLFSIFCLIMSGVAIVLGIGVGYGLLTYLLGQFMKIYCLPAISYGLSWWVIALAVGLTIGTGQLAVGVCSSLIYRITPKDAMLSNETKRKPIPKKIQAWLEKTPTVFRIGVNSMLQNKRRFFVCTFSMFAAFVLIGLTTNFLVSKDVLIQHTTSYRMAYDVQTFMMGELPDDLETDLRSASFVKHLEVVDYTYLPVDNNGKIYHLQTVGEISGESKLLVVPDERGEGDVAVPSDGIILPNAAAETLKVKVGDSISVNGKKLEVVGISRQYSNATAYVSDSTMKKLGAAYTKSILATVTDEPAYSSFLQEEGVMCLSVFSSNLTADMTSRLNGANAMVYILIGFAFVMGFAILAIMSQNALMDQKKSISIMRAIGFDVLRISHMWTIQSLSQLMMSLIFAVPLTILFSHILFGLASSSVQTYPFVFSLPVYLMALAFVILIIVITHLISMRTISRWNLADNTRSRE